MLKKNICISIIGKPNVGKSTLFNKLIEKKISITSKKKNTTQNIIPGLNNKKEKQYLYLDTPGFINYNSFKKIFNKLNNFIKKKLLINRKINLFILIIEKKINFYEKKIIKKINLNKIPLIIIINKIDKIKNKTIIIKIIKNITYNIKYKSIIPITTKKNKYIKIIIKEINKLIKLNKKFNFKKNSEIHNKNFIISEIIREKIFRFTGDEIPYLIKVNLKKIIYKKKKIIIISNINTKKKQHIKILIGKKGNKIKKIKYLSKKDIEFNLKKKIKLFIHINKKK